MRWGPTLYYFKIHYPSFAVTGLISSFVIHYFQIVCFGLIEAKHPSYSALLNHVQHHLILIKYSIHSKPCPSRIKFITPSLVGCHSLYQTQ
ncbi:hypothetical protein X975_23812, partial [Stegodyphus mimosarum]